MVDHTQDEPKPDSAAFDDFFESLGKKAENLTINEQNGAKSATNDTESKADETTAEDDDEPKVVDEIESLCMNCRENVCTPRSSVY